MGSTRKGDGDQVKTDVNYGFPLGNGEFINVTEEFFDRGRTARGGVYTGPDTTWLRENDLPRDAFNMKIGQSKARVWGSFNAVYPLGGGVQLYSFGGLSYRRGKATGFYRLPGSQPERVVFELYLNGFLPQINPDISDRSFSAGVRGAKGAWDVDFSVTQGGTASSGISRTPTTPPWVRQARPFAAGRLGFNKTFRQPRPGAPSGAGCGRQGNPGPGE